MRRIFVTVLLLALAFAMGSPAHAQPVRIRIGWVVTPASLSPILFAPPGVARHLGKSYTFEPVFIPATPQHITALAAGDLEIAALNFASFPLAVENAGLGDLRIIADELEDGYDGYLSAPYMVRNDSGIKSAADLKGKILAVNGLGTGVDLGLRTYLLRHGLHYPGDYRLIEVPFPNMTGMINDKRTDLITAAVPFMYDPHLTSIAHTLFTLKEGMGISELSVWTMRASFIAAHRAAVVDLLEDTVRAYHWYADPANHVQAVAILAHFTKQPPARLDWAFTKRDDYRNPDAMPDLAAMQRNIDAVHALGFIKAPLTVANYADLSLITEADARFHK